MIYIEKSHVIADELAELLLRVKLELFYKKATPMSQQDRKKGQAKSKISSSILQGYGPRISAQK
jgi:hypothetical protein